MRSKCCPKTPGDCKGSSFMAADENSHCMHPTQQGGISVKLSWSLSSFSQKTPSTTSGSAHFLEDWSPHSQSL